MANIASLRNAVEQHHFERSENIIAAHGTNERCYGIAVNEVALRANDVMLRINDVVLRTNGHAFGVIGRLVP